MSFIGPMIPSHLRSSQESQDSDSDSDDNFGPKLPSEPCRGPRPGPGPDPAPAVAPPPPPPHAAEDESESDDDYGPSLPPHLQHNPQQNSVQQEDESSDEDFVGPKVSEITTSVDRAAVAQELEMRAKRMRDKLEGGDQAEVKRETWMLELPEEKANRFGLGARQFSRKGVTERGGNKSAWTDTPEEKARKLREGDDGTEEPESSADVAARMRDERMEKVSKDLKQKRGGDTLMDLHEKKLKKEKKKKDESGESSERRPFDRDIDLKANVFDEAMKKNMLKAAAKIDNRFSSGSQKFL